MGMVKNLTVVAFIAVLFVVLSIQGVVADEKKTVPALEVPAGSAAQMHNSEGIKEYNAGKWVEAEHHFSEAVKADDKSAEAHYNLALSLDNLGKHKEATQEFDQALKLAPNNPAIADSTILKKHLERMKK
jgi:Tfp pilus assembly protein PilF